MLTWTDPDAHCPTCGILVPELERLRAENEAIKEQLEEFLCLAHAVAGVRVLGNQRQVVGHADQWPAVTRQYNYGKLAEDGVDGTALEAELA